MPQHDARRVTAYHEAAHSVVTYRSTGYPEAISIIPNEAAGSLGHSEDSGSDSFSNRDVEGYVLSCYAGAHAERSLNGSASGFEGDDEKAHDLMTSRGWESREAEFRSRSLDLVRKHWPEIAAVADEVLLRNELDPEEVTIVADGAARQWEPKAIASRLATYRSLKP